MNTRSKLFLDDDELHDLTGYVLPSKQIAWLDDRGYPHEENAAGHPRVLRAVVIERMGGKVEDASRRRQRPNIDAIL
ncbi:MAG TPA: DUF4224 domain-containing protein [Azoarcus taiwanensis]|nr:DUF4224 domain-containing protein [Azoarcus taiwanensis]